MALILSFLGSLSEQVNEPERALVAYDNALRHNPYSQTALTQIANIYRSQEKFEKAVDFFQQIVNIDDTNGEIWGAIGNCYLMLDELPKAYQAYQQAIMHLPNPKEPKLWYGIGILYDRYGSYDHAEEAFNAVMNMDPSFDKATEIHFRLGIIHKCQAKYAQSLECFNRILNDPPKPLTETDIWFQIGNVHELNSEYEKAREAYERVLQENPNHSKVLQQLGALYFRSSPGSTTNVDAAIRLLSRALEVDKEKTEAHTWYLLGRCYMLQQQYNKAYESYQQAVYRDGNNANYWCSIGVLYYQINQYRDALDAYSRAIRINPYLGEVWFDLGALYEACNNQVNDAIDAYVRAAELDRSNMVIEQRLELLRRIQSTGQTSLAQSNPPPTPIDPPTTTAATGQPNAPGGPAGESSVSGGVPGSLGAPPMSGTINTAPPPQAHTRHPSDAVQQQPVPPRNSMSASSGMPYANQGVPLQYVQQQRSKTPHQQQASAGTSSGGGGRPGYTEHPGYGRYDQQPQQQQQQQQQMFRPDYPMGSEASGRSGPYPTSATAHQQIPPPPLPPGSNAGYPASGPYPAPSYTQPTAYSNAQGQALASYGGPSHTQPASAGPYRSEDVRMSSRNQSPIPQSHQQQQQTQRPGSAFQQGSLNGHPQPESRSHNSSRIQSPTGQRPHSVSAKLEKFRGDQEDVEMEDVQMSTRLGKSSLPSMVSASAAPINLPQLSSHSDSSSSKQALASSGSALSGQTAAPIRLPPVQGGSNNNSMLQQPGNGSGGKGLAISTTDDDKEGSAINSLMSLSNAASTMTSRPHTAVGKDGQQPANSSDAPANANEPAAATASIIEPNGIKDLEISSSKGTRSSKSGSPLAGATKEDTDGDAEENQPLVLTSSSAAGAVSNPKDNSDMDTRSSGQSSPSANNKNGNVATLSVVPSKRPLSPSNHAVDGKTNPESPSRKMSMVDKNSASKPKDSSNNNSPGPRKHGRQNSPPAATTTTPITAKSKEDGEEDEEEEGEVPEEGEVLEEGEEESGASGNKTSKSEERVMDSGKIKS